MDWSEIFGLNLSPWELIIRGTAMYLFLFAIFRVVIKRRIGSVGVADILVLVIVADAAQNGMSGEYKSVTEAFILVGTIIFWELMTDLLTYRSKTMQKILEASPLLLVDRGRIQWRNMRQEYMSEADLRSKLRERGVRDPSEVDKAYMEPDGQVTVLRKNP